MVFWTQGFEGFEVGDRPYRDLFSGLYTDDSTTRFSVVTDTRAHSGLHSLTLVPDTSSLPLLYQGPTAVPTSLEAWVYLTRVDPTTASRGTPDLGFLRSDDFSRAAIIGFMDGASDDDQFIPNHVFASTTGFYANEYATAGEEIPANGWYRYRIAISGDPLSAEASLTVQDQAGHRYLDATIDATQLLLGPTWLAIANTTSESWFDDVTFSTGPATAQLTATPSSTRRYPLDGPTGPSPRTYPPARSARVYGGHR